MDVILQRSEGGVDSALVYAKTISKYIKDLITYVEKRTSLGKRSNHLTLLTLKNIFKQQKGQSYLFIFRLFVLPEMEFAKGLQRLYQSCKHSITHVIAFLHPYLTVILTRYMYLLLGFIENLLLLPLAPHAPVLHLFFGSGAGPGAECGTAPGQHHSAQPDFHPGKPFTRNTAYQSTIMLLLALVHSPQI